jgi:hypothetical protein
MKQTSRSRTLQAVLLSLVTIFSILAPTLAQQAELRPAPTASTTPPVSTPAAAAVPIPNVPGTSPSILQGAGLQAGETPEQQKLHGLAQFQSLSANAAIVPVNCLPGCKQPISLRCVRLRVRNNGDLPVTIMGDCATAEGAGFKNAMAATLLHDVRRSGCGMTGTELALLAIVGVGSLGFAAPMLYEQLADPKGGVTSGTAFGRDGIRHKVEGLRMTNRLIMPGDETDGALCFDTPTFPNMVRIPVITGQAGTVAGELELTVR